MCKNWLLVKNDIYDYNMRDVIKWSSDFVGSYYMLCMHLTESDDFLHNFYRKK